MKKLIEKIRDLIYKVLRFLTYDIWRINKGDQSANRLNFYNIIKTLILTVKNIIDSQISTRASALTYSTLLAIVPLLAVLFAIARGFGFQNIIESQLFSIFEGQRKVIEKSMEYIDNSIQYAQGGVFLGVGVILLLYTVINLLSNIETAFNDTWGIKKSRSYHRMFTDYLALVIITPILMICNAGISIVLTSADYMFINIVVSPMMKLLPYIVTISLFTFLFAYIPNTKVKLTSALVGGIVSGLGFQLFQWLYINGQIWISKYNTIYGSFAALPLLLLWMQLTWYIVLLGVELSYAYQNINQFSFDKETQNISNRYKHFVALTIMTLIVKRFAKGEKPYTTDELSEQYQIPIRLTTEVLYLLETVGIIIEVPSENGWRSQYVPSIDINTITVAYLFERINQYGSEDFKIDINEQFKSEWQTILELEDYAKDSSANTLLKDL